MRSDSAVSATPSVPCTRVIGRYLMYDEIASGGMASVHFGRLLGAVGFSRTVAIKHLHSHFLADAEFVSMFVDEARLAARIQHPNVASPLDVVLEDTGEIFLIMDYIHGDTLVRLIGNARAANAVLPHGVSASIVVGALRGLHAAHEAVDERGQALDIVHRDISPQNIMVGLDGVARVVDFGVAKAVSRCQSTRQGHLKGKLSYMAPEQMQSGPIDRRVDVFAAGIVLWEALTHRRLFRPDDAAAAVSMIMHAPIARPSTVNPSVPEALDAVTMKALERDLDARFQTAREFADALEDATALASHRRVGEWVERLCGQSLGKRAERVSQIERATVGLASPQEAQANLRSLTPAPVIAVNGRVMAGAGDESQTGSNAHLSTVSRGGGEIISTIAPEARGAPSSWTRRAWFFAVGAALVVLLIAVGGLQLSRMRDGGGAASPSVTSSTPSPSIHPLPTPAPAPLPSPAADPATAPLPGQSPTQPSPAPGPAWAEPRHKSSPPRHARKPKVANRPGNPGERSREDCDPPYTIDSKGIRRVKAQCL